jgi:hypothetical protein
MAAQITIRRVRLQAKYRPWTSHWQGVKQVPWLTVSGVWLEKAGFQVDDPVEITVRDHELIIKNCAQDGNPGY